MIRAQFPFLFETKFYKNIEFYLKSILQIFLRANKIRQDYKLNFLPRSDFVGTSDAGDRFIVMMLQCIKSVNNITDFILKSWTCHQHPSSTSMLTILAS